MQIKNITRGTIVANNGKKATSLFDQLLGLHRKSNPRSIIFHTRFGIHTFFLKEPIDILVLDNRKKVVKIKKNLKPNRLFFWDPIYNTIIELPAGSIKKSKTGLFDTLSFSTV